MFWWERVTQGGVVDSQLAYRGVVAWVSGTVISVASAMQHYQIRPHGCHGSVADGTVPHSDDLPLYHVLRPAQLAMVCTVWQPMHSW